MYLNFMYFIHSFYCSVDRWFFECLLFIIFSSSFNFLLFALHCFMWIIFWFVSLSVCLQDQCVKKKILSSTVLSSTGSAISTYNE